MHSIGLFLANLYARHSSWIGAGLTIIGVAELVLGKKLIISPKWAIRIGLGFLFIACCQAWFDEHRNVETLIGEKASLTGQVNTLQANNDWLKQHQTITLTPFEPSEAQEHLDQQIVSLLREVAGRPVTTSPADKAENRTLFLLAMHTGAALAQAERNRISELDLLSIQRDVARNKTASERQAIERETAQEQKINYDAYLTNVHQLLPVAAQVQQTVLSTLRSCGYTENGEDFKWGAILNGQLPNDMELENDVMSIAGYLRSMAQRLDTLCGGVSQVAPPRHP